MFGKISECITDDDFSFFPYTGSTAFFGVGYSVSNVRRMRSDLVNKKLIYTVRRKRGFEYYVNIPGMAVVWRTLYTFASGIVHQWKFVEESLSVVESMWAAEKMPIGEHVFTKGEKMEEMRAKLAEAVLKSEEARRIRKEKEESRPLTASKLPAYIQVLCEDSGVEFISNFTKKEFGQAKNWLSYCSTNGINPRKHLKNLISFWGRIYSNVEMANGREVVLPRYFNFGEYYAWRKRIDPMVFDMAAGPEEKEDGAEYMEMSGGGRVPVVRYKLNPETGRPEVASKK